jgi:hypothetical protein
VTRRERPKLKPSERHAHQSRHVVAARGEQSPQFAILFFNQLDTHVRLAAPSLQQFHHRRAQQFAFVANAAREARPGLSWLTSPRAVTM